MEFLIGLCLTFSFKNVLTADPTLFIVPTFFSKILSRISNNFVVQDLLAINQIFKNEFHGQ